MERLKAPRKWIKQGMGCEGRAKKNTKKKSRRLAKHDHAVQMNSLSKK